MTFGITQQELDRISDVAEALDPMADRKRMGSWNILHLVCGSLAGGSLEWQSAVVENLNAPSATEFFEFLETGHYSQEEVALALTEEIKEWMEDESAAILAKRSIAKLGMKPNSALLTWMGLAHSVNAYAQLVDKVDVLKAIKQKSMSWPEAFFSAGLLLATDKEFPTQNLGQAILNNSGKDLDRVKGLYRNYGAKI